MILKSNMCLVSVKVGKQRVGPMKAESGRARTVWRQNASKGGGRCYPDALQSSFHESVRRSALSSEKGGEGGGGGGVGGGGALPSSQDVILRLQTMADGNASI